MPQKLVLDPDGVAITRVDPPLGNLPPGWSYLDDDGRSLGSAPPPPPAIRRITLAAFLARITPTEYAGMSATPMLGYALACQTAETNPAVNLDSERLTPLLMLAVQAGILNIARVQELRRDGTPDEAT